MSDKDHCIQKVDAALDLIKRMSATSFPHTDSEDVLGRIADVFEEHLTTLLTLDEAIDDPDTIREHCRQVNVDLVRLIPYLGMILRSSNIRNAFELYFPIKVLAQEMLDERTQVILSSEWHFSPFTYPAELADLPDAVFIGLPASECDNPLLLPLAGHELGHVVWQRKGAKDDFAPTVEGATIEEFRHNWIEFENIFKTGLDVADLQTNTRLRLWWTHTYKLAQRHLEEVFCDLVALHVFGTAYMWSFRYLMSPSLGYFRSMTYPPLRERARLLTMAAARYGIEPPPDFVPTFTEMQPQLPETTKFILARADGVTAFLADQIPSMIQRYCAGVEPFTSSANEEPLVGASLMKVVPPAAISSISAILNAAWGLRRDLDNWDVLEKITDDSKRRAEKIRVLRDLVLKSFEVYEYRKRLERHATG